MALNLLPGSADFPPSATPCMQSVIPAYPYKEYDDDPDVQAFFNAYNVLAQIYIDWFNQINLPIYTGLSGALLDWVGQGLYGLARPTLYSNQPYSQGLISSDEIALLEIAEFDIVNNITDLTVTDDDVYKRVLTWWFYKGDGKQFSAQWLRRRVARFLYGANGGDYNAPSENISLIFGGGYLTITILSGITTIVNADLIAANEISLLEIGEVDLQTAPVAVPSIASILCEAINTGALELPAKFNATCRIGVIGTDLVTIGTETGVVGSPTLAAMSAALFGLASSGTSSITPSLDLSPISPLTVAALH